MWVPQVLILKTTVTTAPYIFINHQTSVPHPFVFFLAKGWESKALNQPFLELVA